MAPYHGIYGVGEKTQEGDLYLGLTKDLTLVRQISGRKTFHVGVIDEENNSHISLLENITLKEWRRFFIDMHSQEEIRKLRALLGKYELKFESFF